MLKSSATASFVLKDTAIINDQEKFNVQENYTLSHNKISIKKRTDQDWRRQKSLCWNCQKAIGRCPWSGPGAKPVPGWQASARKISYSDANGRQSVVLTKVYSCPLFEPDEVRYKLPGVRLAAARLS